jgi:hypothetical protein
MGVQVIKFSPISYSPQTLPEYVGLFSQSFAGVHKFSHAYLQWLYEDNPDGSVVGFDAHEDGQLVAHYACIPTRVEIAGTSVRALLSLNTATRPTHQGRGLFTKLAEMTYALAHDKGFDSVHGVANANSTPGFIKKLGFQLVAPLSARVGLGPVGINFSTTKMPAFQRIWTSDALKWRCESPAGRIMTRSLPDRTQFLNSAYLKGMCSAIAELNTTPAYDHESGRRSSAGVRLFVGSVPSAWRTSSLYVDIPDVWKPAPLNLIYRSLSGRVSEIDRQSVFFSFLDFDAY